MDLKAAGHLAKEWAPFLNPYLLPVKLAAEFVSLTGFHPLYQCQLGDELVDDGSKADVDDDGITPEFGDCDDDDPSVHPGAVDRPDRYYDDTNCDGIDGDIEKAFWVSIDGEDGNPGTIDRPFRTVYRALLRAAEEGKDVYVAGGEYDNAYVPNFGNRGITRGLGIYGGFGPLDGRRRERDIRRYETHITSMNADDNCTVSVSYHEESEEPFVISGLTISGYPQAVCIWRASGRIVDSAIRVKDGRSWAHVSGVSVQTGEGAIYPHSVEIEGCEIAVEAGVSTGSIGLSLSASADLSLSVRGSSIRGGVSGVESSGIKFYAGGGGTLARLSIENSYIGGGDGARRSYSLSALNQSDDSQLTIVAEGSVFEAGRAGDASIGISLVEDRSYGPYHDWRIGLAAVLNRNTIVAGEHQQTEYSSRYSESEGLYIPHGRTIASNNFIYGGRGFETSYGARLRYARSVMLYHNTIDAGTGVGRGSYGVLYDDVGHLELMGNIFYCDPASPRAFGIAGRDLPDDPGMFPHTAIANLFSNGVALYCPDTVLEHCNQHRGVGEFDEFEGWDTGRRKGNFSGDPKLIDPENHDYHVQDGSAAIGRGTHHYVCEGTEADCEMILRLLQTDRDGDPRPRPAHDQPDPDIGADQR